MRYVTRSLVVLLVPLMLSGCETMNQAIGRSSPSDTYALVNAEAVYTLTNLHPDPAKSLLYSINYQQAGFLPLCTKVRIDSYTTKKMLFTHLESGIQYTYLRHGRTPAAIFSNHLDKYFGTTCVKSQVAQLSAIDQQGIRAGQVMVGMSKKGVLLAIGYPPEHATPSTDIDRWTYWRNRFARFIVIFDTQGRVSRIQT